MSAASPLVCVVGSINVDLTFRAPRLPRPGETVLGRSLAQGHGGKGANQAVMAAKLGALPEKLRSALADMAERYGGAPPGAAVAMVGRVGTDAFGEAALANLRGHGIDVTHVRRDPD